jgi:cell division protein FtsN
MTEKGTWYRVYQGGFSTRNEAMAFKEEKGFTEGIIVYAPWTIAVTSGDHAETPEGVCAVLQEKGLDCMVEKDGNTYLRVTVGAFKNYERAQKVVRELLDMGLKAKPIRR